MHRLAFVGLFLASTAAAIEFNPYGSCPGPFTFRAYGYPNARMAVVTGPAGVYTIPRGQPCAGTQLSVANPTLQRVLQLPASGYLEVQTQVPAAACGQYVQSIDLGTCQVTVALPL